MLGIAGLLLTVIVALIIYRRQRRTKYIEWIVFSDEPLVTSDKHMSGIEILHEGRRLASPQFVSLTIYNLSREAIRHEDFETPVTVNVPKGTVVSVSTTTNSEEFAAQAEICDDHTVILKPLLLNYFDKVTLSLLVDGSTDGLDLRSRIVGQTQRAHRLQLASPEDESSWQSRLWRRVPTPARVAMASFVVVLWTINAVALVVRLI